MSFEIAIIGMESIAGQEILNILHERAFPLSKIHVVCEDKNQMKPVSFGEETLTMTHIEALDLSPLDLIFLTGTAHGASQIISQAAQMKVKLIDLTTSTGKTLAVPDLDHAPSKKTKLIASPCSASIQLYESLKPLESLGVIERLVVSTYQSVSELGRGAMDELFNQVRSIYMNHEPKSQNFTKQIAFNVIPQVGAFEDDHTTNEEKRMIEESLSLLKGTPQLSVQCAYVPTFVGHAQSVTVQFKDEIAVRDAKTAWRASENIEIIDLDSEMEYVTPSEINGEQQLFLSRIRHNPAMKNSLSFWSVTDNLKNGASYNGVRIAEEILDVESLT